MIAVVDVCSGNLRSVERALARAGGDVVVTRDADAVRRADKIVVPGQGAFGVFMRGLAERGLGEAIREAIASGRPFLGICLGMQVLFESSEEQGPCAGLGVIAGRVVADRARRPEHQDPAHRLEPDHPAPHRSDARRGRRRRPRLLRCTPTTPSPHDPAIVALDSDHGIPLTAAIRKDNLFACQFHPEKSQTVGLQILRNFVERA